jgi:hypothetical protein
MRRTNLKQNKWSRITFRIVLLLVIFGFSQTICSQVTIGSGESPHDDALLDLKENSSGTATKGLLLPRVALVALSDEAPLSAHVKGMLVYNTADVDADVFEGCYYNDGDRWIRVGAGEGSVSSVSIPDVVLTNLWSSVGDWSVISQEFRCYGKSANFIIKLQYTGAGTNVWNTAHNFLKIAEIPTGTNKDTYKPFATTTVTSQSDMNINCLVNFPARTISSTAECEIDFNGNIYIQNMRENVGTFMNRGTIATNDIVVISGSYFIE